MTEEITVSVGQAYPRDAGRGIARLDKPLMQQIGAISGDIIEIKSKEKCYAIVWPGYLEDAGKDLVRIDGNLRNNAKVGIDEKVTLRKVQVTEAEAVALAPTRETHLVGGARFILRILEGRPVVKGQNIRVETVNNPISFVVLSTKPSGPVVVTRNTQIQIREKAALAESTAGQVTYEDIGGLQRELGLVREMIELPLKHPELFNKLGIDPPKGVLLYGPPGTGKTMIARAVASETDANFISVSGPEIVSKYYGESEQKLRQIFEEAQRNAPSIIFIDEVDSIAPKRDEVVGEMERRIVAQLLSLMDGLASRGKVVVIAATNRPNSIDEALRRGGRFDREIEVGIPDSSGRLQVLYVHTRGMPLEEGLNLKEIAAVTHGFVGADLSSLCKEAAMHALRRLLPELKIDDVEDEIPPEFMDKLEVTRKDFDEALKNIEPSAMREVFVEVPHVSWEDIGGLEGAKQELVEAVEWPLKYPGLFDAVSTKPPRGIMLFGPPGTGKTMLAKAVATESEANFISIKGPELLSRYVGESERAVRETFRKAKQAAPTIVFFDEIDSMASERGSSIDAHTTERVVSQILTEIDGVEELKDVVIIAATNRPDIVDPALLRPGRFDRLIYVRPPDRQSREKIFNIHLADKPLADDVNVNELADITEGYVGADIESICREAAMLALREIITPGLSQEEAMEKAAGLKITAEHFLKAKKRVKPTTSRSAMNFYEQAAESFARYAANEEEKDVDERAYQ
ncbi:CDC48 family AAA ATPase [Methanolobus psychrotolerans]|uniref:CDC48 family AAA ATPase n=1 Tax=Methanolobus psychrotolerans TaxID=1874706 RepID=UPI000B91A716|nr:CDC48 family AAA ATPase [Methanolobus psychrotolerans]